MLPCAACPLVLFQLVRQFLVFVLAFALTAAACLQEIAWAAMCACFYTAAGIVAITLAFMLREVCAHRRVEMRRRASSAHAARQDNCWLLLAGCLLSRRQWALGRLMALLRCSRRFNQCLVAPRLADAAAPTPADTTTAIIPWPHERLADVLSLTDTLGAFRAFPRDFNRSVSRYILTLDPVARVLYELSSGTLAASVRSPHIAALVVAAMEPLHIVTVLCSIPPLNPDHAHLEVAHIIVLAVQEAIALLVACPAYSPSLRLALNRSLCRDTLLRTPPSLPSFTQVLLFILYRGIYFTDLTPAEQTRILPLIAKHVLERGQAAGA